MASSESTARLRLTPVEGWPTKLHAQWHEITSPVANLFAPAKRARSWAPATISKARQGLGKLVAFRKASGNLIGNESLKDFVTESILQDFVQCLIDQGLAPNTQATYVNGIWLAARAISPGLDWSWIGHGLNGLRKQVPRPSLVKAIKVTTDQLFALGKRLFDSALIRTDLLPIPQARMARDGLIIAFLAMRPIRRKNLATLTLGDHILIERSRTRIAIPANQMKMQRRPYDADWPEQLVDELHEYCTKFRPVLLARYSASHRWAPAGDALWVSERGTALNDSAIHKQVAKLTKEAFGQPVNLHRFRNSAAGTVAAQRPDQINLVTPVLGHYDQRSREFYIEADELRAVRRSHAFEDALLENIAREQDRRPRSTRRV